MKKRSHKQPAARRESGGFGIDVADGIAVVRPRGAPPSGVLNVMALGGAAAMRRARIAEDDPMPGMSAETPTGLPDNPETAASAAAETPPPGPDSPENFAPETGEFTIVDILGNEAGYKLVELPEDHKLGKFAVIKDPDNRAVKGQVFPHLSDVVSTHGSFNDALTAYQKFVNMDLKHGAPEGGEEPGGEPAFPAADQEPRPDNTAAAEPVGEAAVMADIEYRSRLFEAGEGVWRVMCRVSGGVTGTRTAYLKGKDGQVQSFANQAEAAAEAARCLRFMSSGLRTTHFEYWAVLDRGGKTESVIASTGIISSRAMLGTAGFPALPRKPMPGEKEEAVDGLEAWITRNGRPITRADVPEAKAALSLRKIDPMDLNEAESETYLVTLSQKDEGALRQAGEIDVTRGQFNMRIDAGNVFESAEGLTRQEIVDGLVDEIGNADEDGSIAGPLREFENEIRASGQGFFTWAEIEVAWERHGLPADDLEWYRGMDIGLGETINVKKGGFHRWLGKKDDSPVTGKDIQKGLRSKDPHARKMANFARNARKWKHEAGGLNELDGVTYEIVDLGIDSPSYFQGHSNIDSGWDESVVGCGITQAEAYDDAVEQLAQEGHDVAAIGLPDGWGNQDEDVPGPGETDDPERDADDPEYMQHYVAINFTPPPDALKGIRASGPRESVTYADYGQWMAAAEAKFGAAELPALMLCPPDRSRPGSGKTERVCQLRRGDKLLGQWDGKKGWLDEAVGDGGFADWIDRMIGKLAGAAAKRVYRTVPGELESETRQLAAILDQWSRRFPEKQSLIGKCQAGILDASTSNDPERCVELLQQLRSKLGLGESLRLVDKKFCDGRLAKVYKESDTGEYVVKFTHPVRGYEEAADYFTDDYEDAVGTASHWVKDDWKPGKEEASLRETPHERDLEEFPLSSYEVGEPGVPGGWYVLDKRGYVVPQSNSPYAFQTDAETWIEEHGHESGLDDLQVVFRDGPEPAYDEPVDDAIPFGEGKVVGSKQFSFMMWRSMLRKSYPGATIEGTEGDGALGRSGDGREVGKWDAKAGTGEIYSSKVESGQTFSDKKQWRDDLGRSGRVNFDSEQVGDNEVTTAMDDKGNVVGQFVGKDGRGTGTKSASAGRA